MVLQETHRKAAAVSAFFQARSDHHLVSKTSCLSAHMTFQNDLCYVSSRAIGISHVPEKCREFEIPLQLP